MKIHQFLEAREMIRACGAILERDAAKNNLLLGSLYHLGDLEINRKEIEADMHVVYDATGVKLAFLKIPSKELMISALAEDLVDAMQVASTYFRLNYPELNGVVGADSLPYAFAEGYGKKFKLGFKQRIMESQNVISPKPALGKLRVANDSESELLSAWMQAFFKESLNQEISAAQAKARTLEKIDKRLLWVWEKEEVVSMATAIRPTRQGITIALVYTPKHLRGQGFASNLVASLTNAMFGFGKAFCCLHVDADNPTSNKIYEAIGYQEVAKGAMLLFENS